MDRLVEEAVEEAQGYVEEGFTAVKMKIGLGDPKLDIRRVAAVREAIGADVRLMVDANHCLTVPQAIRIGRELEKLDVEWFEEPISPEDIDGYVEVTRALDMAVAGGENEMTRWGFRDLVVRKAMDIVQPDVCAAGGISECRKIATLAAAHGVECVPHAWGSVIGVAATLHFLAALPDQPPSFRPMPPMFEFEQCENPFRDLLAKEPIVQSAARCRSRPAPGSASRSIARSSTATASAEPAMRFVTFVAFRDARPSPACCSATASRDLRRPLASRRARALLGDTPPRCRRCSTTASRAGSAGSRCPLRRRRAAAARRRHAAGAAAAARQDRRRRVQLHRRARRARHGRADRAGDVRALRRTVIGPGEPILMPPDVGNVGYEAELAAVIGAARCACRATTRCAASPATPHNDVSGSDLVKQDGGNFVRGKNLPASAPLGPGLVSADELPDPYAVASASTSTAACCRTARRGRCCSTSPT